MDLSAEDEFRDFVVARSPVLLGMAYALTGDRGLAEDLLQTALLKTYNHWRTVRTSEQVAHPAWPDRGRHALPVTREAGHRGGPTSPRIVTRGE